MKKENKSEAELLQEKLVYTKKSFFKVSDEKTKKKAMDYAKGYIKFLDASKTEREAVKSSVSLAEKKGYMPFRFGDKLVPGGNRQRRGKGSGSAGCRLRDR